MRRIGMNPARDKTISYKPARVTAAVLTYIPVLEGYFTERLDILRVCIGSMRQNTQEPFDLMVFDNGSCEEVSSCLQDLRREGKIQYLLSSRENIGKTGALKMIFGAAPGEVVAYCDDDVYHYPGWLESQLEILDHFPNVGMVSGVGIRVRFNDFIQSNLKYAEKDPEISLEYGRFIPQAWEHDFCLSTGRDPVEHSRNTEDLQDIVMHYHGKKAFAMANHFQFISPREVLLKALMPEWTGRLMREMAALDQSVEKLGYLRLSTIERKARHMGNALPDDLPELETFSDLRSQRRLKGSQTTFFARAILKIPGMKRLLRSLYHRIFVLLNRGQLK